MHTYLRMESSESRTIAALCVLLEFSLEISYAQGNLSVEPENWFCSLAGNTRLLVVTLACILPFVVDRLCSKSYTCLLYSLRAGPRQSLLLQQNCFGRSREHRLF